jgi:hypothetical protein
LLGIGIGIIIATLTMASIKKDVIISDAHVEERARILGMNYPGEEPVINKKDVNK